MRRNLEYKCDGCGNTNIKEQFCESCLDEDDLVCCGSCKHANKSGDVHPCNVCRISDDSQKESYYRFDYVNSGKW